MLPRHARMRRSEDFRRTVRRGVRAGRRTVVVHALRTGSAPTASGAVETTGSVVGFVVSKTVGSAVQRNRVRRRLRHLVAPRLVDLGQNTLVVVRALPPAAGPDADLGRDLQSAWTAALSKLSAS